MRKIQYKSTGIAGLFDHEQALEQLSNKGNALERLSEVLDFEIFRELLEDSILTKEKKNNAGAKPYDVVMLFKILILQRYFGLSDGQVEYQIIDRASFKAFLGLSSGDKVPDEKTVWSFREKLTNNQTIEKTFVLFRDVLNAKGLILNEGKMVDATFATAPIQRNTREENKQIKDGDGAALWNNKPHKKRHKDIDARWTQKGGQNYYGYKNHTKVDAKSKFIDCYKVTDASVHDSQPLEDLLDDNDKGQPLYGDSAYTGANQDDVIENAKMINQVCERGYRNHPLTNEQKASNREKSSVRSRVEHVFGFMEQSMHGIKVECVGIVRATGILGLMNLTYNLFRYEQVVRLNLLPIKN
ncbi:Mobile element protein [Mucinivorans hirudinis]|uniref:Mobile element protein n=1 Tax=Mucinivorans hirudinis TaxID=1433126 RepID=A0A060RDU5_9BACT|nr:Mobile element protein [Mucinivorans hirudinis]